MVEPTLSTLQKTRYYRDLKAMEQQHIKQGLQKGMKQGMEKGERKKQELIARNMLAEGLDIALIARVTGLSQRAVKALQTA